jgi:hypothetical protein
MVLSSRYKTYMTLILRTTFLLSTLPNFTPARTFPRWSVLERNRVIILIIEAEVLVKFDLTFPSISSVNCVHTQENGILLLASRR